MTNVTTRLVGYDRTTEELLTEVDIPATLCREALKIAYLSDEQFQSADAFYLGYTQAESLHRLLNRPVNYSAEYFIERSTTASNDVAAHG
jgi:hypothetical protein